jgi:phospholipid/cholesterol/gamma-HCH transport system permease protein
MLERLGRAVIKAIDEFFYSLGFFVEVLKESILIFGRRRVGFRVLVVQILYSGYDALRVIGVVALVIGAAIILIGSSLLADFGQGQLMYTILIIVIARELGPLLTAFVIIARSGTAIATELGGMVVYHEIDAYIAVGLNPIAFLAAPRFMGVVVSMLVLTIYFDLAGLAGSFAVVQLLKPIGFDEYFRNLLEVLKPGDLGIGLLKSFIFGILISVVSLYQGFRVERASTEVPVAGIRAVGSGFMLCIMADLILIAAQYVR